MNPYQDHITRTYRSLRETMLNVTIAMPLLLWLMGEWWHGVPPQKSLSAYYMAGPEMGPKGGWLRAALVDANNSFVNQVLGFLEGMSSDAPMRTWFVGMLFVLGICLVLYHGLTPTENVLLDIAGVLALGVALFPDECGSCQPWVLGPFRLTAHSVSAYTAFICLGCVALLAAVKAYLEMPAGVGRFAGSYLLAAVLMIVLPGAAYLFRVDRVTFWMEALGLWAFALYWVVKSIDLEGNAEHWLIRGLTWLQRPFGPLFGWLGRLLKPLGDLLEPVFRWLTHVRWVANEVAEAHAAQLTMPESTTPVPAMEGRR